MAALAILVPCVWSQAVVRVEFEKFYRAALRELVRGDDLDAAALEHVRQALVPRNIGTSGLWDKNSAAVKLTEALKQGDVTLRHNDGRFEIRVTPRTEIQPETLQQASVEFVDSLSTVIRRLSIMDQLGQGRSFAIEQDQLQAYLKDTVKVSDHEQVAKSFDSKFKVEGMILQEPATLWRIYGGELRAGWALLLLLCHGGRLGRLLSAG